MFERICLQSLVNIFPYTKKVLPHINPEYFGDEAERVVFNMIKGYVGKYNVPPTKEALAIILSDTPMNEMLFERTKEVIQDLDAPMTQDIKFLTDKTEQWAQERALINAVTRSISIIDGTDKKLDKNAIPGILTEALGVSFDSSIGHDYFADAEKQWEYINADDTRFAFAQDTLNRVTKGGVGKKTLNIVQAGINVGKTTFLIDQAAHWLEQGKNVVYFTLEVAENVIRLRSDVRLMGLEFDGISSLGKTDFTGRVNNLRNKTKGEFIIKEFPTGTAHVGHFRHVLDELKMKKGFSPDVIIVDYLTIMASSKLPASAKSNSNTYFTSVAEELRGLGVEYDVPIWTATQFGRSGQTADDVDMTDLALAIGIANTADFMVAFMQPEQMAKDDRVIGKVLKNRYANKSKIGKFIMGLNNDLQKLYDVSMAVQAELMDEDEQAAFKGVEAPKPNEASNLTTWKF